MIPTGEPTRMASALHSRSMGNELVEPQNPSAQSGFAMAQDRHPLPSSPVASQLIRRPQNSFICRRSNIAFDSTRHRPDGHRRCAVPCGSRWQAARSRSWRTLTVHLLPEVLAAGCNPSWSARSLFSEGDENQERGEGDRSDLEWCISKLQPQSPLPSFSAPYGSVDIVFRCQSSHICFLL